MTTEEALRSRVQRVVDSLPEEALREVAAFLEAHRYGEAPAAPRVPAYEPVALGGLWRGTSISDEDIEDVRREMWSSLEDRIA